MMKYNKQIIKLIAVLLILFTASCKDSGNNNELTQNTVSDKAAVAAEQNEQLPDTISQEKPVVNENNESVNLPFDFEERNKLANTDESKLPQVYPVLKDEKLQAVKKIISTDSEDNPDIVFKVNNGTTTFDTYVYCTYGDSDSQTIINVKDSKIIAKESIGYAMPENETYQSFVINKDLSISVYGIDYNTRSKKILEKYQIKQNGSVVKLK
ncbi:hypothetical protein NAT51_07180 [Flavobacterium amniphilum]|uniref:hypothetical protein n=1 Tax=Flavobacterium amniphilum TaxID=1834035 RepID=UPI00202A0DE0|nr:hypothetical protein [Flavobacterium amniphilum]MCL9805297.1 hypothetical protein [Flavobacterium amniphilum]